MATYNFTVRATDNLGAFADQNFSLTVNNTNIERFVVVGSTGLSHSSDGVTWTPEAGQSGGKVVFGNGKWVVYSGTSNQLGMAIRTSTDAFNWTTVASGIPTTYAGLNGNGATTTSFPVSLITSLKYQNNVWTAFCATGVVTGLPTTTYYTYALEYTSTDLVTWTFKSATQLTNANSGVQSILHDHYIDANGNCVGVVTNYGNSYIYNRTASATTLTSALNGGASVAGNTIQAIGHIAYTSGLYSVSLLTNISTTAVVYTSIDGIGWTQRTAQSASTVVVSQTYANGRLVGRALVNGQSAAIPSLYSLNGGRTWQNGGNYPVLATTISGYGNSTGGQNMAYYAGRLISITGSLNANYLTSTDSGTTWTESNVISTNATSIGTAYAIGVRV